MKRKFPDELKRFIEPEGEAEPADDAPDASAPVAEATAEGE